MNLDGTVRLKRFSKEYVTEDVASWLNDPQVTQFSRQKYLNHTLETVENFWRAQESMGNLHYAILNEGKHVGNLTITVNGTCGDIALILGGSHQKKGVGLVALKLAMRAAKQKGLTEVTVGFLANSSSQSGNKPMERIAYKAGFVTYTTADSEFKHMRKTL